MDRSVANKRKNQTAQVMAAVTPALKKQRRTPGPCTSCKMMGHASKNNKKCPNYEPKNKVVTPVLAPSPDSRSTSSHDSSILLDLNKPLELDKPVRAIFEEELIKACKWKQLTVTPVCAPAISTMRTQLCVDPRISCSSNHVNRASSSKDTTTLSPPADATIATPAVATGPTKGVLDLKLPE
jgi:hypothetical protein